MTPDIEGLLERLEALLAKATPGDLSTAERHVASEIVECPACHGEGEVEAANYCNFDDVALGVQFYGIGNEFGAHEALWRETIKHLPSLIAEIRALREALGTAEDALRNHACHGGPGVPCRRTQYQCQIECGKEAGDALLSVLAALGQESRDG